MAVDAAFLIRVGSSVLFIVLGLAVLVVGRRKLGAFALGAFLVCLGSVNIVANLNDLGDGTITRWTLALFTLFALGAAASTIVVARHPTEPRTAGDRRSAGLGVVVGLASLIGFLGITAQDIEEGMGVYGFARTEVLVLYGVNAIFLFGPVVLFTAPAIRVAKSPPTDRPGWIRSACLFFLVGPYVLLFLPSHFGYPTSLWTLASVLVVVLAQCTAWLVAAWRSRARFPVMVALLVAGLGAGSYAYTMVPAGDSLSLEDPYGVFGIARIVGWLTLVYAIVRLDFLGVKLPRLAVSRGFVAAGALATLFIVAQVAQNFLSSEYGLLTGGIIAGAVLFAANPVQKAIEARTGRGDGPNPVSGSGSRQQNREEMYRKALRIALVDRKVSRDEELLLFQLAEELGIGAGRAMQLRQEVEASRGVA